MSKEGEHKDAVPVYIDVNENFVSGFAHRGDFKTLAVRKGQEVVIDVFSKPQMTPDCLIATKPKSEVFRWNPPEMLNAPDMTVLTFLEEPNMLQCLELRHKVEEIYTKIAGVLVAVNPYHQIPHIYTLENMKKYRNNKRLDLTAPHVFGIGEMAYQEMIFRKANQSMICCGESGSGKTESTKWLMRYLANVKVKTEDEKDSIKTSLVEQQVIEANPVLEAFGNAKTLMNDNSSRFAKFTKLFFSKEEGRIVGAHTLHYLLEKSRVTHTPRGERNFHIFYQICAGIEARRKKREGFVLSPAEKFRYTSRGGCFSLDGVSDAEQFDHLQVSMDKMGISEDDQEAVYRIVAALLHLGNVEFVDSKLASDASEIDSSSMKDVQQFAELIDLKDLDLVKKRLLIRNITVKNNENYEKMLTVAEADDNRDAMAKAIYNELFSWIVSRINQTLYQGETGGLNWIGILDVFGFECFEHNSFEQFCINFANEKLQEFFNDHIIKGEQREYRKEGIFWVPVDLPDNLDCIKLIDSKPSGILCLLDSACIMPKGSPEIFRDNLFNVHKHARLTKPDAKTKSLEEKGITTPRKSKTTRFVGFSLRHYAGKVTYDCDKFLEKNTDRNHPDTVLLLYESRSPLVKSLFADQAEELKRERRNRFNSLGSNFSRQLGLLMATLRETTPYFIRCVSPNAEKSATKFVWNYVKVQLRCGGLVQALKLLKCGYPNRFKYDEILKHYGDALKPRPVNLNVRDYCEAILVAFGCEREEYQLGLNKVFFKQGKREFLEDIFKRSDKALSPEIEAKIRKWLVKKRVVRMKGIMRSYLYINERLRHIRAFRNFRAAANRALIYCSTLRRTLERVRKRQAAKANAITFLQGLWRHNVKRKQLLKFLGTNAKRRRQNKFFQPQLDQKTKEELARLKSLMASAQQKAESALAQERELKETLEKKKLEYDQLQKELELMKQRDKEHEAQGELVDLLKKETERMKEERLRIEEEAKKQIDQKEKEFLAKQAELERIRKQREEMAKQHEEQKRKLEKEREEERKAKEEELRRLGIETQKLKEVNEKKALEAQKLLQEREEENKKKEAYLVQLQAEAEKLKAQHDEETEAMRLERETAQKQKEEELKALKEQTEKIRKEMEAAAELERQRLKQVEEESKRKERDLLEMKEREERLRKEHEERAKRAEEERIAEKKRKDEELAALKAEAEKTKREQEEKAAETLRQLKQREEENQKKQENLQQLQAEADRLRKEHEERLAEARRLMETKEKESQEQIEKAKREAEEAGERLKEQEAKLREETQAALERQLKQREAEQQTQLERMKQIHDKAISLLEEQIRLRDEEITRLRKESAKLREDHEAELEILKKQLKVAQETIIQRDEKITALNKEMAGMQKAHKDLNEYSETLIKEAEEDKAALQKELSKTKAALDKLQVDYKDLETRFQRQSTELQEESAKKIKTLQTELEETEGRFKRKLKGLEEEIEDTIKRRIKVREEELEMKAAMLKSTTLEATSVYQRQLTERSAELQAKEELITTLKQEQKDHKAAYDKDLEKLTADREAEKTALAAEIAKLQEQFGKEIEEKKKLTEELAQEQANAAEKRLHYGALEKKVLNELEFAKKKAEDEADAYERTIRNLKAEAEKMKKQMEEDKAAQQQEIEKLNAEWQAKFDATDAEVKQIKKDHGDLVKAYREQLQNPHGLRVHEDMKNRRQSSLMELTKANMLLQRTSDDFVKLLKRREGWMMKRRPKGTFGQTSDKERYVVLEGDQLSWYAGRPGVLQKKGMKPLGTLELSDYKLIAYNDNHASALEAKETKVDIESMSKSFKYTGDIREFNLRLFAKKGRTAKELHLLQLPDVTKPGSVNDILDWVEDINRRICVTDYLKSMFAKKDQVHSGMGGCREVVDFLCSPTETELIVSDKVTDLHEALIKMKEALRTRKGMRKIEFKNVALADPSVQELAQIVGHNNNLITLDLSNNNITSVGAEALATALHTNTSLTELDLSYNQLGSKGLMMLASALPVHNSLSKLNLVGNKISDEGIEVFVEWLLHAEKEHNLPLIELAENEVGAKGCAALCSLLAKNHTISRVDLSHNLVDDEGAEAFAQLLKSGKCHIKELFLSQNHISSKGASSIADALKTSAQELTVDLSGNKLITRQGVADVIQSKGNLEFVLFKVRVTEKTGETPLKLQQVQPLSPRASAPVPRSPTAASVQPASPSSARLPIRALPFVDPKDKDKDNKKK